MNWDSVDWPSLERLRTAFLNGTAGGPDYWQTESDLASYDLTFAQRIGWKWDWVLDDLQRIGWQPPADTGGGVITGYTVTATPGGQTLTAGGTAVTATMTGRGRSVGTSTAATTSHH